MRLPTLLAAVSFASCLAAPVFAQEHDRSDLRDEIRRIVREEVRAALKDALKDLHAAPAPTRPLALAPRSALGLGAPAKAAEKDKPEPRRIAVKSGLDGELGAIEIELKQLDQEMAKLQAEINKQIKTGLAEVVGPKGAVIDLQDVTTEVRALHPLVKVSHGTEDGGEKAFDVFRGELKGEKGEPQRVFVRKMVEEQKGEKGDDQPRILQWVGTAPTKAAPQAGMWQMGAPAKAGAQVIVIRCEDGECRIEINGKPVKTGAQGGGNVFHFQSDGPKASTGRVMFFGEKAEKAEGVPMLLELTEKAEVRKGEKKTATKKDAEEACEECEECVEIEVTATKAAAGCCCSGEAKAATKTEAKTECCDEKAEKAGGKSEVKPGCCDEKPVEKPALKVESRKVGVG